MLAKRLIQLSLLIALLALVMPAAASAQATPHLGLRRRQ